MNQIWSLFKIVKDISRGNVRFCLNLCCYYKNNTAGFEAYLLINSCKTPERVHVLALKLLLVDGTSLKLHYGQFVQPPHFLDDIN